MEKVGAAFEEKSTAHAEIIESYKVRVDNLILTVNILGGKGETKIYHIVVPKIAPATKALMEHVKHSLVSEVAVSTQEILDPKSIQTLKDKFTARAEQLLKDKMPSIDEQTMELLINVLMQEMLGLGEVEYILADENLEEVVILSALEPVRVYHKKHGWLETNIRVESEGRILNFANIIGRRVGRQITTLNPLLDAHMITGDRSNAVLFPISTKGHTITIRKFARDPWTMTDFVAAKTVSSRVLALIWLAIQYEMNVLISGGTASGKTSFLNVIMPFIPPNHRIVSIEDSVDGSAEIIYREHGTWKRNSIRTLIDSRLSVDKTVLSDGTEITPAEGIEIFSVNGSGKVELRRPSSLVRHYVHKPLFKVTVSSGKSIRVTGDHSLFSVVEGTLCPVVCKNLHIGDQIAVVDGELLREERFDLLGNFSSLGFPFSFTTLFLYRPSVVASLKTKQSLGSAFHDTITSIEEESFEGFVYDLSVPGNENFICENIVCHNTRELQLPKWLYWCPLTVRQPNPEGKGAVEMLDLLINSLRMRPDRIVLGEMRKRDQAEVLFEAMHTGHSVYATVHADSIAETIQRLINPPIEVPQNLLTGVNMNVVMFRDRRRGIRRVFQVGEFIPSMEEGSPSVRPNIMYRWKPATDEIVEHAASLRLFEELSRHTGMTLNDIEHELSIREKILEWMVKNNIRHVDAVGELMRQFYIDPDTVKERAGVS